MTGVFALGFAFAFPVAILFVSFALYFFYLPCATGVVMGAAGFEPAMTYRLIPIPYPP